MTIIRPTRPADTACLPNVERSAGEAFRRIPDLAWIADDDVQSEEHHRRLIDGGAAWVAVDATNIPIGFLSGELLDGNLHIWELAVGHAHQGRGIGRALVQRAKRWALARPVPAVTLTTFRAVPWNEPFYRSLGFTTLPFEALSQALRRILADEAAAGLPAEGRCAMRWLPRQDRRPEAS